MMKKRKLLSLVATTGLLFAQFLTPLGQIGALMGYADAKNSITEVVTDGLNNRQTADLPQSETAASKLEETASPAPTTSGDDKSENTTKKSPLELQPRALRVADDLLTRTGSFKVKKVDEDGKTLLGNAKFRLMSDSTNTPVYQTELTTSIAGEATFSNIPPGTYLLKEIHAPSGYQEMTDCYKITVSQDGYTQYTYVKTSVGTEVIPSVAPSTGEAGSTEVRAPKTSGVVTVENYQFTTKNKASGNADYKKLWATSGEFFDMSFTLKVKEGTQPGDSFTIKLSPYLSPNGIREKFISAPPLMLDNQVVATGIYDEKENSYIYTFNDLITRKKNITLTANYTFSPEAKKVDREWYINTYNITNVIDEQKQDSGDFTIDYGEGQYMAGVLNSGLRLRNNVTYLNRTTGEVEYTIYLNNGASPRDSKYTVSDPWVALHYVNVSEKSSAVLFNKDDITVYRVPLSQKTSKMPYSMSGETDGLEIISVNHDNQGFSLPKGSFYDSETKKNTAGILIKIKAKIDSPIRTADVSLNAIWKYTQVGGQSNAKASAIELGNTSSGSANNIEPTLTIRNYKKKKGSIAFTKQDSEEKTALKDVTFKLEKKAGDQWHVVDKYKEVKSETDGKLSLIDLDPGEYQLIETKPLDGYLIPSGPVATFTITDQGTEDAVKPSDKVIQNTKPGHQKIKVVKKDEQSSTPLSGATFQLESSKGVVLTGETNQKGEYTFKDLPFGEYLLTEIRAPKGYILDKTPRTIIVGETSNDMAPSTVQPRSVEFRSAPAALTTGKDVSDNIVVKKVEYSSTNGQEFLNVNPNHGENLIARTEFELKKEIKIQKGDYFAVKLSENIDPFGIATGETTSFNIVGTYGILAVGKYDNNSRSIIYTFTDYVEKYEVSRFSTILPYFIDRYTVKRDQDIVVSTSVSNQEYSTNVRVLYTPYYGATDSYSPVNIGSMLTKLDLKQELFTNYVYINPRHESIRNGELYFIGDGSAIINEETSVTLFKAHYNENMPPSWGVNDADLTEEVNIPIVKKNGQIYINFGNNLQYRDSFVMKVVGRYDTDSDVPIKTSATLYQNYYNYYGYYTENGRWIPQGPYSEYFTYNAGAVLKSGESSADGAIRVSVTNRKNSVAFTKTNGLEKPLEATFELRRLNSNKTFTSVKTTTSTKDTGTFSFEGMEAGSYEVWETQSPEGYLKPDKAVATFKVDKDGTIKDLTPDNGKIINYPNTAKIIFTKMLASEKGELSPATKEKSATFSLWRLKEENLKETNTINQAYDEQHYEPVIDNNSVRTVTSDSRGNVLFDKLSPGFYAIKEEKAPDGYVKQQGIVRIFQVDSAGKVIKYQYSKDKSIADKLTEITALETEQLKQFDEIVNKQFVFPMTGGQGVALFVMIGGAMMGIAYLGHRRKQKLNS
ncbi:TPA: fibrinogen-binding adhesin SdrG C-terminal domain-containing protein [Streptococcus equi subsp. zooepidemicus]|uniref:SpaA isopeptide-forming pilin-related protein n=2 Tax=Streptococcus equi TaxID=1336 RepID=UPI001E3AD564|nr:SpaA isopeptide-forming pilin-related protein [Streptococcus equi]MCD3395578.1 fibrinogen-binding adhesin SdrG C-terminal domain-containing protein [Streptococcus equi subsp. zooepidemicus]MCD3458936.1 fibrinogen-binding adhesin SdrG C-terminal domain-containing protein [Streptococcus equi subsp. zooepidemicus]MDI5902447.1 SpaA isopeptide-forming pilin-related protein [Streptococcus equi subsp. zooepidemicus]MDI5931061.1 SpaA isopeptide-forming pilin-related protein [Streptococcus equi subsp